MNVLFIASVAVVAAEPAQSRKLLMDTLGLRLEGDGWLSSIPDARRRQLADEIDGLVETHRRLWLARNRPGGLADSVAWLEHLTGCYRTGTTDRAWGGW